MVTVPIAVLILLALALLAGGWLAGHGTGKPRCVVCARELPRVCPDARCGREPGRTPSAGLEGDGWNRHVDGALALAVPAWDAQLVDDALSSLRAFGDITRDSARQLLEMWARRHELTDVQVGMVLAKFPLDGVR